MSRGTWLVVQHVRSEGPGLFGAVAAERGITLRTVLVSAGDPVPERVDDVDGLLVLGGPMAAWEDDRLPALRAERALLASATHAGLPVLGICLGAQLLAAALGARVWRGDTPEVGPGEVTVTADDPVLGPAGTTLPVLHWHHDTFDVPEGASLLASSRLYPGQAFRVGDRAYGLQFHLEPDAATVERWRRHLPPDAVPSPAELDRIGAAGRAVFGRLLDRCAAPAA